MTLAFVLLGDFPIDIGIDSIEFQRCSKYGERVIGCHHERQVHGDKRFCMRRAANRHEVRIPRVNGPRVQRNGVTIEDRHPSPEKHVRQIPDAVCRLVPPLQ